MTKEKQRLRVAIGGFGAIGKSVARALDKGIDGLELTAVSAHNVPRAEAYITEHFSRQYKVVALEALAEEADVVVECCPAEFLSNVASPALMQGKTVIVISVGALLFNPHLEQLARDYGGRILVPSGALLGLDAVQSVGQGKIHEVKMITQKPPLGLNGAPALVAQGFNPAAIMKPTKVFEGTAEQAIVGFPANLNVAVALGLAGSGVANTHLEIWADPTVVRNTHTITVKSDSADLTLKIENIPTEDNPKTGKITALSVISTLRRLTAPVVIGA
ncbi:aspartate dehydrogenase [Sulfitobacter sp. G21635-S1]|jgi:aspartate dehydrogenase|uniref:aspartate dehydrogenase n=1 Tax=Sulfitobacter sp. G21635-S1 TaxID=3014043 RepID=UPI0022B01F69|nr:aspartate dehydrogenase [Sulfitobacter sp. G21635-S1]MCZ4257010.1 aspartate dehydrogenase [Sulfitobacter sp. G21635-S1]